MSGLYAQWMKADRAYSTWLPHSSLMKEAEFAYNYIDYNLLAIARSVITSKTICDKRKKKTIYLTS